MRAVLILICTTFLAAGTFAACATGDEAPSPQQDVDASASTDASVGDAINSTCGANAQPCCAEASACNTGLTCISNICRLNAKSCGGSGQPCCSEDTCDTGFACDSLTGKCAAALECGQQDAPCCTEGDPCGAGLECTGGLCGTPNCGTFQNPCCLPSYTCELGLQCGTMVPHKCVYSEAQCGNGNKPCCPTDAGWCSPGWLCDLDAGPRDGGKGTCYRDPNCKAVNSSCSQSAECCNGSNCVAQKCEACGDFYQTCCNFGTSCKGGLGCVVDGIGGFRCLGTRCGEVGESCGGNNPACCTGNTCNGSNKCCRNAGQAYLLNAAECCSGNGTPGGDAGGGVCN